MYVLFLDGLCIPIRRLDISDNYLYNLLFFSFLSTKVVAGAHWKTDECVSVINNADHLNLNLKLNKLLRHVHFCLYILVGLYEAF